MTKPTLQSLSLKKNKVVSVVAAKPPQKEEMVQVTLRVPKSVRRELRRLSFEEEKTQSALFCEAVSMLTKEYAP